jgi:tetratricopeptide (TPR) repeat protein
VVADIKDGVAETAFNLASLLSKERAEEVALIYTHFALHLRPDFVVAHILLGEVLQGQGRGQEAIAAYRQVPADSPFRWTVQLRIAEELARMERIDDALAELESLAELRGNRYEPLFRLGNLLRTEERFEEAVEAYDRAAERIGTPERRHWTLYYFRGIVLERLKRWTRAEKDLLFALELEPEQPFVMNYLAYSWVEKKLNLDQAKSMLVRAVELRPDDGYIVDSLGWVYYRLGEYKKGVTFLERAVELRPQDPVINDHLGDAFWRVGRHQEARFQWRRALSLEPEEDVAPKIEAKIESGLGDSPEDI